MDKMIELRKVIQTYLKSKHARVYFQVAPDNATYPFVVYELPNSIDDGAMERFVLDIDVWDDESDTTSLETLASNIDNGLHRLTVMSNGLGCTFYRENRMSMTDDDSRLRRRKLIYQIRTHEGG
jgi:hypothetical protein